MAVIQTKHNEAYAIESDEEGQTLIWEAECLVCGELAQARVTTLEAAVKANAFQQPSNLGKLPPDLKPRSLSFFLPFGIEGEAETGLTQSCEHVHLSECYSLDNFEQTCWFGFGINWSREERFLDGTDGPAGGY